MYDTVCETKRKVHEVEDDVVNCETVVEEKCENVLDGEHLKIYSIYIYTCACLFELVTVSGILTKLECETWPVAL